MTDTERKLNSSQWFWLKVLTEKESKKECHFLADWRQRWPSKRSRFRFPSLIGRVKDLIPHIPRMVIAICVFFSILHENTSARSDGEVMSRMYGEMIAINTSKLVGTAQVHGQVRRQNRKSKIRSFHSVAKKLSLFKRDSLSFWCFFVYFVATILVLSVY
jgi:hypothetical protein